MFIITDLGFSSLGSGSWICRLHRTWEMKVQQQYSISLSNIESICFSRQEDAPRERDCDRMHQKCALSVLVPTLLQRKRPSCIPPHDFLLLMFCRETPWSWMAPLSVDATDMTMQTLFLVHFSVVDCTPCVAVFAATSVSAPADGVNPSPMKTEEEKSPPHYPTAIMQTSKHPS